MKFSWWVSLLGGYILLLGNTLWGVSSFMFLFEWLFLKTIKAYSKSSYKRAILPSEFVHKYESTKSYYFHYLVTSPSINGNRSKVALLQNEASMRCTDQRSLDIDMQKNCRNLTEKSKEWTESALGLRGWASKLKRACRGVAPTTFMTCAGV